MRTSPDHGTAFDIAGTGRADPTSLIAALQLAADMAPPRPTGAMAARRRPAAAARGHRRARPHGAQGARPEFLLDLNLTATIARAAGAARRRDVVEVGPGPGGLTRALLPEGARHVVAIERDAALPAGAGRDRRGAVPAA